MQLLAEYYSCLEISRTNSKHHNLSLHNFEKQLFAIVQGLTMASRSTKEQDEVFKLPKHHEISPTKVVVVKNLELEQESSS